MPYPINGRIKCPFCGTENDVWREGEQVPLHHVEQIVSGIPLDRLEEICQAERKGRCMVLPCKVGDILYQDYPEGVDSAPVMSIEVLINTRMGVFEPLDLGETVFLDEEASEAAEAAMKEEDHELY